MKPAPFDYFDPSSLQEALELLADLSWDASLLAGGQSLIPMLNMRIARPSALIDLRRVPGLDRLDMSADGIRIGAMVRAASLERSVAGSDSAPTCLGQALREIGHPQIRNRTTIGGNLAHADPASELPAVFVALGGTMTLVSKDRGERSVPAEEFFQGVFSTAREPDEILVEASLPTYPGRTAFVEVARRPGDFSLVGACVAVVLEELVAREVRIAMCGTGDRPRRLRDAEAVIEGAVLSAERLRELADAVSAGVQPRSDLHASDDYRRAVAGVMVRRALERITGAPS
jgi:carbon-monoxide dehydrogenase medium subunit